MADIDRRGLLISVGAIIAMATACNGSGDTVYRFKLTVEVETPQGVRRGSAVYEVKAYASTDLASGQSGSGFTLRGEALAVDMPDGKTLFALAKTTNPMRESLVTMSLITLDPAFNYQMLESAKRVVSGEGVRSPAKVPIDDYPMLVTFENIDDPASLKAVDPVNLSASFGEGIALKQIVVERTDEPVTIGITKRLPWLKAVGQQRGTVIPTGPRLATDMTPIQTVAPSDFDLQLFK